MCRGALAGLTQGSWETPPRSEQGMGERDTAQHGVCASLVCLPGHSLPGALPTPPFPVENESSCLPRLCIPPPILSSPSLSSLHPSHPLGPLYRWLLACLQPEPSALSSALSPISGEFCSLWSVCWPPLPSHLCASCSGRRHWRLLAWPQPFFCPHRAPREHGLSRLHCCPSCYSPASTFGLGDLSTHISPFTAKQDSGQGTLPGS